MEAITEQSGHPNHQVMSDFLPENEIRRLKILKKTNQFISSPCSIRIIKVLGYRLDPTLENTIIPHSHGMTKDSELDL